MLPLKPRKEIKNSGLKSAAVVFFMGVAFCAAHDPSSSLFVFAGPFRLHGLQYLAVIVAQPSLHFGDGPEAQFDDKALEQSGTDVAVGLVVVLSVGADLLDGFVQRLVQGCLQVVQDEVAVDVLPAIVDSVCREVGKLEERLDDKETGLDAPAFAVDLAEVRPVVLFFVEQRGEQHLGLASGQHDSDQAVGDGGIGRKANAQFRQGAFCLDLQGLCDNLLIFATLKEGFYGVAVPHRQADDTV